MQASFSIDVDQRRRFVHVVLTGFFGPADAADFAGALRTAYAGLRCGPNQHSTLVDVREMEIQSQDRIAEFQALLSDRQYKAKRLAFVVAHSLARLQAKRAAEGRDAAFFMSEAEALRWLFEETAAAA